MLSCSVTAQVTKVDEEKTKSPRQFVQDFYKWYVPRASRNNANGAWNLALKYKSSAFTHQLSELLRQDSAAQAKCKELVGLDFDPFLNSQDPADRYDLGKITQRGQIYRVDIYAESEKKSENPSVRAEIAERNGRWLFVNFYYSDGTNLLGLLQSPRPKCSLRRNLSNK
ncbi:MAG: hypothetical protein JWO13_410 [Acidobacteriales bacterium]|nr:hypothetical protein [Terriglobales bacterium]